MGGKCKKESRNKGQTYLSNSKHLTEVRTRALQQPCNEMTCRLKCCTNVNLQARNVIFQQYWGLGNLQLQ